MRTRIDFGSRDQGIFKIPVVGPCGGLALWLAAEAVCVLSITCKVKRQMKWNAVILAGRWFKICLCVCVLNKENASEHVPLLCNTCCFHLFSNLDLLFMLE